MRSARRAPGARGVEGSTAAQDADRAASADLHRRDRSEHQDTGARTCARGERLRSRAPWPLEDHDLHRRAAPRRHRRAEGPRRPDERQDFRDLCATGARSEVAARRYRHHGQSARPQSPGAGQAIEAGGAAWLRFCRPTAPTSIPSKWPSPSSRPSCAPWPCAPSTNWEAIGQICDLFTPEECTNYFEAAGLWIQMTVDALALYSIHTTLGLITVVAFQT